MIVALFSLAVSFFTLWFAHLRPPDIRALLEPKIEVYRNFAAEGGLGVLAIVTFANKSLQAGIVVQSSLSIGRERSLVKPLEIEWNEFNKFDAQQNRYVYDEHAHALTVPGNSTVTKQIWFHCFDPNFYLDQARYILTLSYWGEKKGDLRQVTCKFTVSPELFGILEQDRRNKSSKTHKIQLEECSSRSP
jgi:hypothetical protein